jgi:polysaccharide export outer membrane protein
MRPFVSTIVVLSVFAAGAAGSLAARGLPAQFPQAQLTQQATALQDSAEALRQRLQQSGMTAEQIRMRLQASGFPPNLLDTYLQPGQGTSQLGGMAEPTGEELAAAEALGLPPIPAGPGLPVDTGFVASRAGAASAPSRVFGIDAFRRNGTLFLPTLSGPVPPDYRLGPGDVLVLILTGEVELAYTLRVTREGFILIPQVGQVFVSNLTLSQLQDLLYARLGRVYSGVRRGDGATTHFDVSVANVRTIQVYVAGEISQPGAYQISALGTALTALYAAGGVTERGNLRDIPVQRGGTTVATLDLYDFLLHGKSHDDVRLETGDVVFVPVHGTRVDIGGAVVRPAIYELKGGETLADVIRDAGGFRPDAALRRVTIYRILPAAERGPGPAPRAAVDVALTPAPGASAGSDGTTAGAAATAGVLIPDVAIQDGDSVVVDALPPLAGTYYVSIAGMVNKPGLYPWRPGTTLRDLMLLARGPRVGADLREAEIARLPQDRSQGQLATTIRVPLDSTYLLDRDSLGHYAGPPGLPYPAGGTPEVTLQPYDNVLILRQPDFDLQRTVEIVGEVRYPGAYSLRTKGDRLADLIQRAGGLTRQAYAEGIRFVRSASQVGRIDVDLAQALRDTTSSSNITLQPGDSIEIPEFQPAVKVTGAVNSPGSILWKRGEGLGYYLSGAGGFSYQADKGRVSVRYANGEVRTRHKWLFFKSDPTPGPGSEVLVPPKNPNELHGNFLATFASTLQLLASSAAILVALSKL